MLENRSDRTRSAHGSSGRMPSIRIFPRPTAVRGSLSLDVWLERSRRGAYRYIRRCATLRAVPVARSFPSGMPRRPPQRLLLHSAETDAWVAPRGV